MLEKNIKKKTHKHQLISQKSIRVYKVSTFYLLSIQINIYIFVPEITQMGFATDQLD